MEKDKLKGFIEVLIPITKCNIHCHYCYVAQRHNRTMKHASFKLKPKDIGYALRQNRLGGIFYISICGAGETMMVPELPYIVLELLSQGHLVNITTNGTITKCFTKLFEIIPAAYLKQLNFSFSYHLLELKRTKLKDVFWKNVVNVRDKACSFVIQFNLCDEYVPLFDEIKSDCLKHVEALPQVAATRDEVNLSKKVFLFTKMGGGKYQKLGKTFQSPLFNFTMKNFRKKQSEFCYAGKWTYVLNLETGILKPCYCSYVYQNIYKDLDAPIHLSAIGKHCKSPFCMNSSHFLSLGCIPSQDNPTYAALRNRNMINGGEWYHPYFKYMLSQRLCENNNESISYSELMSIELQAFRNNIYRYIILCIPHKLFSYIKKHI